MVACLLFGGTRKQLPDGMKLRGDINVLLLGDPGTGKSQILKFAQEVAPVGVFTSGKVLVRTLVFLFFEPCECREAVLPV